MGVFDTASQAGQTTSCIIADGTEGAIALPLKMANRHGLVAGATGTGKTVTLQRMAEQLARCGTHVLCVDVKGDLSGIAAQNDGAVQTVFWDVFGVKGHALRTTMSDVGPMLLARLLDLSDAQTGTLQIAFKMADDQQLLLLDLKDLKAVLSHMAENASEISRAYGLVSPASVAAIQRALLGFESEGGDAFFGEPALDVLQLMPQQGSGTIHVLAADRLMQEPRLYATVMLWLLAEFYENMPEAGDLQRPKIALFIDEAHLLFKDAPKVLVEKIEQVIRLIRSKGVGIYFVTQNPMDLPETVLGQLGNRVQHALRAFTPNDQKDVRAAAQTFRANPAFKTEEIITQLGIGEALVSFLDEKGQPCMVQKARVRLPESQIGALGQNVRHNIIAQSPFAGMYDHAVDRDSAYERLSSRLNGNAKQNKATGTTGQPRPANNGGGVMGTIVTAIFGDGTSRRQSAGEALVKSVVRSVGSQIGREIMRGMLGSARRR